jgi:hypothetical protein
MVVSVLGIVTEGRWTHPWNAEGPRVAMVLGMVSPVRPLQSWKVDSSMVVTPEGRVGIAVRP